MKKVDSAIQLAAKHVEEAKAQAEAELARTEVILAQEQVQTERERAVADRSHEMSLKRVKEQGEVDNAKAETDAAGAAAAHPRRVARRCTPRPRRTACACWRSPKASAR